MQEEIVDRRGWLTREQFLDLISAANVIPGPNSTEVAIHVGFQRGRWAGLVVAGVAFILPAALIVGALAALYVRFGTLPAVAAMLYGVKPVVITIVLQAIWKLGRSALKTRTLAAVCVLATAAALLGVDELLLLAIAAVAMLLLTYARTSRATASSVALLPLFLVFLKIGAVLFGSGYVLLAFLRHDLVTRLHWLTEAKLLDAIAVGQITPGPVFTTATFIGYLLAGPPGAVAATVAIFLPAFVFVAASGPFLARVRRSPTLGAALDGINAASLALMIAVSWQLARAAVVDLSTLSIAIVSAALLLFTRINPTWLVAGSAAAGIALALRG
jgi:chromate transporter